MEIHIYTRLPQTDKVIQIRVNDCPQGLEQEKHGMVNSFPQLLRVQFRLLRLLQRSPRMYRCSKELYLSAVILLTSRRNCCPNWPQVQSQHTHVGSTILVRMSHSHNDFYMEVMIFANANPCTNLLMSLHLKQKMIYQISDTFQ